MGAGERAVYALIMQQYLKFLITAKRGRCKQSMDTGVRS